MSDPDDRYVLLCRHARHDDGRLVAVKGDDDRWRFPTGSVGRALAEELLIGPDRLRLAAVGYAATPEASGTAAVLLRRVRGEAIVTDQRPSQPHLPGAGPITVAAPDWLPKADAGDAQGYSVQHSPWPELLPHRLPQTGTEALERIHREVQELTTERNTLLLVGHQPQMGWLSCLLTVSRLRRRGRAVPLTHSEIACLRLRKDRRGRWRGALTWTFAPDDRAAHTAVIDKVKGKMESAKLLSGVLTLVLTALLGVLLNTARWDELAASEAALGPASYDGQSAVQIAFVLLLAALLLYLTTMYAYDRLLMPTRFWADAPGRGQLNADERAGPARSGSWLPRRPPSSSAWVVLRNMQRTWFWLFTPANVLVALALMVLAAPLLRLHDGEFLLIAVFGAALGAWCWWFRPVLGSED